MNYQKLNVPLDKMLEGDKMLRQNENNKQEYRMDLLHYLW